MDLLAAGGATKTSYMTDNVTHVIADAEDDEVIEAREIFLLSVVKVSDNSHNIRELSRFCFSFFVHFSIYSYSFFHVSIIVSLSFLCDITGSPLFVYIRRRSERDALCPFVSCAKWNGDHRLRTL